jgi:hypothetical protein
VGLVEDVGVLLIVEHIAMVLSMLGVMLVRPAEYTGVVHRYRLEQQVTA